MSRALQLFCHTFSAMGGPCEFKLYCASSQSAAAIFDELESEVRRLEAKYSRYLSSSIVSKINSQSGSCCPVDLDTETFGLLQYADQMFIQSGGMFDASSGVLRRVWNFKEGRLPSSSAIEAILPLVNWNNVSFTQQGVSLKVSGMEVDFGGFGKEYATDLCAVRAESQGIKHGLVNLGGDIRAIGPHPDGKPWQVGIQHPRRMGEPIATVALYQGALATSGDYERYMVVDGVRYSHLLNPKTGQPLELAYCSASVIAETCLVAGSFTTLTLLLSSEDPSWLSSSGLPYLLIDQSMQLSGSITLV